MNPSLIWSLPCSWMQDSQHGPRMNAEWTRSFRIEKSVSTLHTIIYPRLLNRSGGNVGTAVFRHRLEMLQWPPCHRWWDLPPIYDSPGMSCLAMLQGVGCSPGGSQTLHNQLHSSIVLFSVLNSATEFTSWIN